VPAQIGVVLDGPGGGVLDDAGGGVSLLGELHHSLDRKLAREVHVQIDERERPMVV
jgi:hypothetical protein